jgi:hypothetical protein
VSLAPFSAMKKVLLLLALSSTAVLAQEPAPAAQTQPPAGTNAAPATPTADASNTPGASAAPYGSRVDHSASHRAG